MTYYLIKSQEQLDLLNMTTEDVARDISKPELRFFALLASTLQESETALFAIARDMEVSAGLPFSYHIVDLRH